MFSGIVKRCGSKFITRAMSNRQSGVTDVSLVCVKHFITQKSEQSLYLCTQVISQSLVGICRPNLGCISS
jgi:hypothetical protein